MMHSVWPAWLLGVHGTRPFQPYPKPTWFLPMANYRVRVSAICVHVLLDGSCRRYGGGRVGLSDTMVGTFWTIDALFAFANAGAVAFHLHWGKGGDPAGDNPPSVGVQTNFILEVGTTHTGRATLHLCHLVFTNMCLDNDAFVVFCIIKRMLLLYAVAQVLHSMRVLSHCEWYCPTWSLAHPLPSTLLQMVMHCCFFLGCDPCLSKQHMFGLVSWFLVSHFCRCTHFAGWQGSLPLAQCACTLVWLSVLDHCYCWRIWQGRR